MNIPIHFTEKDRWIYHRFASPPMGNGNWGSEIIVLVDNFGETYYFSESDSGNGYSVPSIISFNKEIKPESSNYPSLGCTCKSVENRDFAFTDDFIDILKATPDFGFSYGSREKQFQKIDEYVKTLIEKNKKTTISISRAELNVIEINRSKEKSDSKVKGLLEENNTLVEKNNMLVGIMKTLVEKNNMLVEKNNMLKEEDKKVLNDIEIRKEREIKYWERCKDQGQCDLIEDDSGHLTGYVNIYMYAFNESESTKYDGYKVYGSWDNWKNPYEIISLDFLYDDNKAWIIELPEKYIGKYYYKLKKDGAWIEPTEDELRIKDENGNWNNVIFIH
jgi:hypothetical protein